MRRLRSILAATSFVMLPLFAGCAGKDDPPPANAGGISAAGTIAAAGGVGGFGAGGALGSAGVSGMGAGAPGAGAAGAGIGGASSSAGAGGQANGSAGATGSDGAIPATFATVKLVLGGGGSIMPCAAAPCHGVNGVAPPHDPLELPPNDDAQLYMNLTTYVSRACDDTRLVTPGNPAQSALLRILRGPCGMTPRMPYGCDPQAGDCIPDEYVTAVEQWIASGAPQ